MGKREQAAITEHRDVRPPSQEERLCGTALLGDHSFTFALPADGPVEVGRGTEAELPLVGTGVSRAHARLVMHGDRAILEDLGSRNGTFLNGKRIDGPVPAGHGDEIGIGDARIVLLRSSALPPGTQPAHLRRSFVSYVDHEVARGRRPAIFVLQVPEAFYELAPVRDLVAKLGAAVTTGIYNDHVLTFAAPVTRAEAMTLVANAMRTLRIAGVEVACGLAGEISGDANALLNDALEALLQAEEDEAQTAQQLIVTTPTMVKLHEEARRIAQSPITVLLVGETGVGKEVFAHTIHRASGRSGPLVAVNTAALPEQLLESELFGHERGAFSGAAAAKPGLIESAHGGTLFLDEIGELPMSMQAKLLRVLEDRTVRRVGATTEKKVDVRVIAATNCDLDQSVLEKRFRQDLLFRLNGSTLVIPPLRERAGEIPRLSELFLVRAAAAMNAPQVRITPDAMALLEAHPWPGNVRELRNVIERAVALAASAGGAILPEHLPSSIRNPGGPMSAFPSARSPASMPPSATTGGAGSIPPEGVRDSVRDFERQRILLALQESGGNQTKAAAMLGLPRRTLAYKIARLGLREK